jgi:hypothetical protein
VRFECVLVEDTRGSWPLTIVNAEVWYIRCSSEYAGTVSRLASRVEGCQEGAMRSASKCKPKIVRGESAGGAAGAMQCDAGGLGVQRLEACRDVGAVWCATALAVDERA